MILIKHISNGELQTVESADGYGADEWQILGDIGAIDPTLATYDGTQIVADLAPVRAARSAAATAYRDQRIDGGCTTSLGIVDADDASRTNILGAVSMAMIAKGAGAAYSIGWRMHDNTYQSFDADQMIQLGVEVGQFVNACYQASFTAKNAIASAADQAAINAVDVTAGYPA